MKAFRHDSKLPPLPLPSLQSTCDAVKDLVAPLTDSPTLAETIRALDDFSRPGGSGGLLHAVLAEMRGNLPGNASWLRPFWDDMYLRWRGPLPVALNYYFALNTPRWGGAEALPRFIRALCRVFMDAGNGLLEPEAYRQGSQAMDQLRSCLYTRIPGATRDSLFFVAPGPLSGPLNAAVVCRGHWFLLPLLDAHGVPASEGHVAACLTRIRKEAEVLPPAPPVTAASSAPREEAARLRADLQAGVGNALNLTALEKALFVLCLDPPHATENDFGLACLCGDAANRWFDKSLQVIASENGGLGVNLEHAGCDAGLWVYLLSLVDTALTEHTLPPGGQGEPPRRLVWDIPASLAAELEGLRQNFAHVESGIDLVVAQLAGCSRGVIKSLSCSPDAFVHLAFQTAQYRTFRKVRSTYEAVSMRCFAEGRTECARSSTAEALAFARALEAGTDKMALRGLFRAVERAHLARLVRCQRGLGAERHMYGLQAMYDLRGKDLGIDVLPAIFSDTGWKALRTDSLSTSAVSAPCIDYFGFGPTAPVEEQGVGLGYGIGGDHASMVISCFKAAGLKAGDFSQAVANAAREIAACMQDAGTASKGELAGERGDAPALESQVG